MWIGLELIKKNWVAFSFGFAAVLGVVALIIARSVTNAPGGLTLWTILGSLLMGIGIGYLIGAYLHIPFVMYGDVKAAEPVEKHNPYEDIPNPYEKTQHGTSAIPEYVDAPALTTYHPLAVTETEKEE